MKLKTILFTIMVLMVNKAYSQSTSATISGGWATIKVDDYDYSDDGFKIGGLFESVLSNEHVAIGGSISYMGFSYSSSDTSLIDASTKYHAVPINFSGKLILGKKLQGYIKGIAGFQISTAKISSQDEYVKYKEFGWSYGYGAGIILHLNEKTFLNADWEADYLTNSDYSDVTTNAFSLGIGFVIN